MRRSSSADSTVLSLSRLGSGSSVSDSDAAAATASKTRESSKDLVLRALKAISKSSVSALQLDQVPKELLFGEHVDLHRWTMILTDENMKQLSEQRESDQKYRLDTSSDSVLGMFHTFYKPLITANGLLSLNISHSKQVTDYGITVVVRRNTSLTSLNISSCTSITDVGLREVGINCNNLQELKISSCHEIDGTGLVAIAEKCRYLIKLDVSKCRKLDNWSIKKIFYECKLIEEVNLSYISKISDDEVRVLAQNCPNLVTFQAVECPCISDESIQAIAMNCTDIDLIDISRTSMVYRVNDISLLAFAQKSKALRILRLNGCDHITDVGLTWLAEGCHIIEELDIGGCERISDAGLRSIGNGCHALTSINLSSARLVSDIGVASLSSGCPKLRRIRLHGMYLLTDPRLSAPKRGAKLEAWQNLIGVAALAENCPLLDHLDLSGCFRLNIALHQYVSSFKHITTLNLSGCNQSSTDALTAVARGCTTITDLNLSDCGKAVNNKTIQAFATNCRDMKVLTICRCLNFSGGAIKAISTFRELEKLDFSGCRHLTDSMLVHLAEPDRMPKLRTLNFTDLISITDSLIAWLSIRSHRILLFAMKGTCISMKAIMSVRDRYPNSEFLQNENFYGFWPKMRVDDRMLINKYHVMKDGIIRIQGRVRKLMAVKRIAQLLEGYRQIEAQLLLQRVSRGFTARMKVKVIRDEFIAIDRAASLITTIFYMAIARKVVKRRKLYLAQLFRNQMACRIQMCYRLHYSRNIAKRLRLARQKLLARREFGALKMQSVARIYFSRIRIRRMKELKRAKSLVRTRKASVIQRVYRGFLARRECLRLHAVVKAYWEKIEGATITIQRKVRCLRTKAIVQRGVLRKKYVLASVIKIQALMRGSLSRIHVAEIRTELYELRRLRATIKIQTRLRMLKARMVVDTLRRERDRARAGFDRAANIIIHCAKRKLAYLEFNRRLAAKRQKIKERAMLEFGAICKIQALVRGVKGRELYDAKLREKKGKWKELFDETVQKRFFYNKLSGEIRWRMPQDLLDLIPHPRCDNCTGLDAVLECYVCNELYCSSCWSGVHAGGRRRDHQFRTLYDFYGRRIDYGDGDFPCKWPSEVIQDEVQGWMLRVAPSRLPLKTYPSGWEEYRDFEGLESASTTATHQSRSRINKTDKPVYPFRVFYFNRKTFETTYDMPEEVTTDIEQEEKLKLRQMVEQQRIAQFGFAQTTHGYYDGGGKWVDTAFSFSSSSAPSEVNDPTTMMNYDGYLQDNQMDNYQPTIVEEDPSSYAVDDDFYYDEQSGQWVAAHR